MQVRETDLLTFAACKSCGGASLDSISSIRTSNGLKFFQRSLCNVCGLLFASTTPSLDWFLRFWSQRATTAVDSGESNVDPKVEQCRVARYRSYVRTLTPLMLRTGGRPSVLDIGCGPGSGLHEFVKAGWDVRGIELDPERADYCEKHFGIPVIRNPVEELNDRAGTYDAVLVAHVLEHIHDLNGFLQAVRLQLNPNGILYVEVPDLSVFVHWIDALYLEHQQTFTFGSLGRLLCNHGFQVVAGYRPKTQPEGVHHIAVATKKVEAATHKPYPCIDRDTVLQLYQKYLPFTVADPYTEGLEYVMDDVEEMAMTDSRRLQLQPDHSIRVMPTSFIVPRDPSPSRRKGVATVDLLARVRDLARYVKRMPGRLLSAQAPENTPNPATVPDNKPRFDIGVHDVTEVERALTPPPYALFLGGDNVV